jgi:hypothetical protein
MKLKLGQLIDARGAMQALGSEKLPVKLAYRIQRNMRKMETILHGFDEARLELIKKYGTKGDAGVYTVKDENVDAFTADIKLLRDEEEEVDIHTIDVKDFPIDVAPLVLMALDFMFVGEEEGTS